MSSRVTRESRVQRVELTERRALSIGVFHFQFRLNNLNTVSGGFHNP
jgi:hypothetical protein